MTRREEIELAASCHIAASNEDFKEYYEGFIAGAKWADKTMIIKACDWLKEKNKMCMYELEMILGGNFIKDFKKAMELCI